MRFLSRANLFPRAILAAKRCSRSKLVLLVAGPARKNPDANQRLELMVFGEGKTL